MLARVRGTWAVGACVGVVLESMSFAVSDAEQAGGLAGVDSAWDGPSSACGARREKYLADVAAGGKNAAAGVSADKICRTAPPR